MLSTEEIAVLADDDYGNAEQQSRSGAHHARTQRADQREPIPVASPSRITDACYFGMSCRIASLYAQVVTTRDDLSSRIGQHRPDGQAAFTQTEFCFSECFLEQSAMDIFVGHREDSKVSLRCARADLRGFWLLRCLRCDVNFAATNFDFANVDLVLGWPGYDTAGMDVELGPMPRTLYGAADECSIR